MPRPVTLFTGQWTDLPIEDRAATAGGWGFDGLELASWGDHFEVEGARGRRLLPVAAGAPGAQPGLLAVGDRVRRGDAEGRLVSMSQ